jgi:hypothetical protein
LIGANTKLTMSKSLPLLACNSAQVLIYAIEHNEIIAGTMHFGEA